MKRHTSLVPLSHNPHHALARTRQLHRVAVGDAAARRAGAATLLRFVSAETVRLFRHDEERLFPLPIGSEALRLDLAAVSAADTGPVADLPRPRVRRPLRGTHTDDLNATLLAWDAGDGPPEHVNGERDPWAPMCERRPELRAVALDRRT